ncbi:MAG: HEAT repeat domain-containing protein, partial [Candidatus Riflebacteria bacterium]|nr:HEAT repeat domain-containing protein [Candidatus Riflebacteria bacterium]
MEELLRSADESERVRGLSGLLADPCPEHLALARELAQTDPSLEVRFLARRAGSALKRALGDLPDQEMVAAVAGAEADEILAGLEAGCLGFIRTAVARDLRFLVPRLRARAAVEGNPVVLSALVLAIGHLGEPADVEALVPFLEHADPRVRANTVEAIDAGGPGRAWPHLLTRLQDPDNRVRANAARVMRGMAPAEAGRAVAAMVRSSRHSMQASGAFVLRFFPGPAALSLLEPLLGSEDACIRNNAVASLKILADRGGPGAMARVAHLGSAALAVEEHPTALAGRLERISRPRPPGAGLHRCELCGRTLSTEFAEERGFRCLKTCGGRLLPTSQEPLPDHPPGEAGAEPGPPTGDAGPPPPAEAEPEPAPATDEAAPPPPVEAEPEPAPAT